MQLSVPCCSVTCYVIIRQETRMLSQALNREMLYSRNQLEGVNHKEVNILFSCSVVLYFEAV